eukprot:5132007-Amphidinium_carterae.1
MIQASYIKFHPTSGYNRATPEVKRYYDGFQIYNFNDAYNPQQPVDDSESKAATLQQVLAVSYHYAPKFFDAMNAQKLTNLREIGFEDEQIQAHEEILRKEKIMELHTILPEKHLIYGQYAEFSLLWVRLSDSL